MNLRKSHQRDRLVFGIRHNTVRERLLRKSTFTLTTTDEVCHAAESMRAQMKMVDKHATVNAVKSDPEHQIKSYEGSSGSRVPSECWNCGLKHDHYKRERCPALGKQCNKCQARRNKCQARCNAASTEHCTTNSYAITVGKTAA